MSTQVYLPRQLILQYDIDEFCSFGFCNTNSIQKNIVNIIDQVGPWWITCNQSNLAEKDYPTTIFNFQTDISISEAESINIPTEEFVETVIEESINIHIPTEEFVETVIEKSINIPTEEFVETVIEESINIHIPTEEFVETVIEKSINIPTEEFVETVIEKSTNIPTEEFVETTIEESIKVQKLITAETPIEQSIEDALETSIRIMDEVSDDQYVEMGPIKKMNTKPKRQRNRKPAKKQNKPLPTKKQIKKDEIIKTSQTSDQEFRNKLKIALIQALTNKRKFLPVPAVHNVLIFGQDQQALNQLTYFLAGSENYNNVEINNNKFNFIVLPTLDDPQLEKNFDNVQMFVSKFCDYETITSVILCLKEFKDVDKISIYTQLIGSLVHANLISVIMSKNIVPQDLVNTISKIFAMNMIIPVYRYLNDDENTRFAIIDRILSLEAYDTNKIRITKTIFYPEFNIDYAKIILDKIETLLENFFIRIRGFDVFREDIIKILSARMNIELRIGWNQAKMNERDTDYMVLIADKTWKPIKDQIIELHSPYKIMKFVCAGFQEEILEHDNGTKIGQYINNQEYIMHKLKIRVKEVTSKIGFFSVYTDRKLFYVNDIKESQESHVGYKDQLTKVYQNIYNIQYKMKEICPANYMNGLDLIDQMEYYLSEEIKKYNTTLYLSPKDVYEIKQNIVENENELAMFNIDLINDPARLENVKNRLKKDELCYLSLEKCEITNELLYDLLELISNNKNIKYFSVSRNPKIDERCVDKVLRLLIEVKLSIFKIEYTNILTAQKIQIQSFLRSVNRIDLNEKDPKRARLEKNVLLGKIEHLHDIIYGSTNYEDVLLEAIKQANKNLESKTISQ